MSLAEPFGTTEPQLKNTAPEVKFWKLLV